MKEQGKRFEKARRESKIGTQPHLGNEDKTKAVALTPDVRLDENTFVGQALGAST